MTSAQLKLHFKEILDLRSRTWSPKKLEGRLYFIGNFIGEFGIQSIIFFEGVFPLLQMVKCVPDGFHATQKMLPRKQPFRPIFKKPSCCPTQV